jgi:maltose O-acetyltransferase
MPCLVAFNSNTPERIQQRKTMQDTCRQFERSPSHGNLKRLKCFFNQCGDEVFIEAGFHCDYGKFINLGNRVYINAKCTFLDGGIITIGDDCLIGPNVQILAINHDMNPQKRLDKLSYAVDTKLGDNVWIGAGAIILPGVSIGSNTVIGAGAVVTKSLPPNCFAAGNPASIIKDINNE